MAHEPSRHGHLPLQVEEPWRTGGHMEGPTPAETQNVWSLEKRLLVGWGGLERMWEERLTDVPGALSRIPYQSKQRLFPMGVPIGRPFSL